jgi:hypothetical protein
MKKDCSAPLALMAMLLLSSCATYVTPGRQANMASFTDPNIKKAFEAKPAIHMPANLAVVRVQDSGYRSASVQGVGTGAYSVVTVRDIETQKDFDAISKLPGISGVATLNRLLLPREFTSDLDLRQAAARLQTDAILIYTIGTQFSDNEVIAPLTTLTLGLAPNKHYKINSTASAILMDTRTGFVYGAIEENDDRSGLTIAWGSSDAIDAARKKAERAAFEKLVASFGPFWARVYSRYH